jgi:hypothetical protein
VTFLEEFMRSLALGLVAAIVLPLAACSGKKDDTQTCAAGVQGCAVPWDCAVGYTCENGCCAVFGCTPDSCADGTFCDPDTKACTSISQKCEFSGCQCNIVNAAGELEATGAPTLSLPAGAQTQIAVVLAAVGGLPLPGATFTYSVSPSTLFTVSSTGLVTAAASGSAATETLTARAGTYATCTANLAFLGSAPTGGNVRFFVFDDNTALPVSGAVVYVDHGNGDGIAEEKLTTTATGLVQTAIPPVGGKFTVTVFAAGYNYLSLVGLNANSVADVALPLAARKVPKTTAGFSGKPDFIDYERLVLGGKAKTVKFGIVAGSFLLKSLLNFDLSLFMGSTTKADCKATDQAGNHAAGCYPIDIPGIISNQWSALPGGVILSLATNPIKSHFDSVAQPGRRYAWGFGGEVEIGDMSGLINILTPLLSSCDCDLTQEACDSDCACDLDCGLDVDLGQVLNNLLPLFARFASGVKGDLPGKEVPFSTWESYIANPYGTTRPDAAGNFPVLDTGSAYGKLAIAEPLLSFTDFTVPALPIDPVSSQTMDGVLVLTGVNSKGYGFVPLGISAGLDCTTANCLDRAGYPGDFDGHINGALACLYDSDPTVNGCPPGVPTTALPNDHIGMFHAKAHGGLQDQEWLTIAIALPLSTVTDAFSAGVVRVTASVVRQEPANGASSQLNGSYPGFPAQPATTTGRTYTVAPANDAQIHWVTFATDDILGTGTDWDGLTTRWNVYFPAEGGTFTAPTVPTLAGGNPKPDPFAPATGTGKIPAGAINVTHVGFRAPGVTLGGLAANSGTSVTTLIDKATGFAVQSRSVVVNP